MAKTVIQMNMLCFLRLILLSKFFDKINFGCLADLLISANNVDIFKVFYKVGRLAPYIHDS